MSLQQHHTHHVATTHMEVAYRAFLAEINDGAAAGPCSPVEYVRTIIPDDFAPDEHMDAGWPISVGSAMTQGYTNEVVSAIRTNDVATLRQMLERGQSFNVCNSNGEYLIHLACRRSQPETVEFLIKEACVRADVRDRMGRTILHDVCWKSTPDVDMMATVLQLAPPELLLAKDMRGHTPFDFARKQHSQQWNEFLFQNRDLIQERLFALHFNKWLEAEDDDSMEFAE